MDDHRRQRKEAMRNCGRSRKERIKKRMRLARFTRRGVRFASIRNLSAASRRALSANGNDDAVIAANDREVRLSQRWPSENAARRLNYRFGKTAPQRCHPVSRSAMGRVRGSEAAAFLRRRQGRQIKVESPLPSLKLVAGRPMFGPPQTESYAQRLRLTRK